MTRNVYGLDLGTYQLKIYDKKEDRIWMEKNVVAISEDTNEMFAYGDVAYSMFERAPEHIRIEFPMKEGVISRFYDMQILLTRLLKPDDGLFSRGTEYVVAVPTDVTEVEKKAFYDLAIYSSAKAKKVNIVERALADAVGLGLDIMSSPGAAIVNIGGETTDISIVASGGIVMNRLLKIGGVTFDNALVTLVRHNQDFAIGRLTAEAVRKKMNVFWDDEGRKVTAAGIDLAEGGPRQQEIPVHAVRAAMREPLKQCADAVLLMLERTPPEVLSSIRRSGIYLTGGVARTPGITDYLEGKTGLMFHTVKEPEYCVAKGLREIIRSPELGRLAYSMKDENYRWMR
ncbi:rod shape-determining protein [Sellimonas caecigallum]|uniref:Rod shape-determining protein n=1 Tax=Sellimonas caecigallum TaxID=2592333 RepID=A0ABS7L927_9FIRM|nr:rod shape-determining protein [Sellimonas caecigallum]MBY0759472.1 rod shape-determining protein [Sellimonas caecigallum]